MPSRCESAPAGACIRFPPPCGISRRDTPPLTASRHRLRPQQRVAASALSDIAKHSPELAQSVVDAGAVAFLAPLITSNDSRLKRQVCSALGQVAKHSVDLAEVVVEAEIFPKILTCLKDMDTTVRKHAATCIREVAKHTPELAQLVVSNGGVGALVDYVSESEGNNRLPGMMALGFIAAFNETLALAVIASGGLAPLYNSLANEPEDHIKSAAAWGLGQIGRHSPDHAKAVSDAGALPKLVQVLAAPGSSEDLRTKAQRALKAIINMLTDLKALDRLLQTPELSETVAKYIIGQIAKVLPNDPASRHDFVTSGGFATVQALDAAAGSAFREHVEVINSCFPPEIVKYYSPGYSKQLLEKLETPVAAN